MFTSEELINIVSVMNKTTCSSNPFPSKLLMSHLPNSIEIIMLMINLCISTSVFPSSCKSAIVLPLIKKLHSQLLKKTTYQFQIYCFCLNLLRMLFLFADNDLIDKFQSAYRCGHSTEAALFRVYSDIVTMVSLCTLDMGL